MEVNCARIGCPNTFPKNGKQKYCRHSCATLDNYHHHKQLKGRHRKPNRVNRNNICGDCGSVTKLITTQVNSNEGKYYAKIGRVCLTCRTVTIDPKWIVSKNKIQVIPPMGVTA